VSTPAIDCPGHSLDEGLRVLVQLLEDAKVIEA
jgi:hypothetical protein